MNDTLDHTDTRANQPRVHHDPLGGYGYTPDPVTNSPWWRAREAEERAERTARYEARYFADYLLRHGAVDFDYAAQEYRRAKAAYEYATAVRQVETQLRWPDGIPTRGASA